MFPRAQGYLLKGQELAGTDGVQQLSILASSMIAKGQLQFSVRSTDIAILRARQLVTIQLNHVSVGLTMHISLCPIKGIILTNQHHGKDNAAQGSVNTHIPFP